MRWILAAVLLLVTALPGVCGGPDFSWGNDCRQLAAAQERWNAAASILPHKGPQTAQPQPFDIVYIRHLLSRKDFNSSAFSLLDDAMRRSRVLEESRKLYGQALEQCGSETADELENGFDTVYREMRYHVSLATALARAGVARRMADGESSGYCFQAMESAIDTLSAAMKEETDKKRLEKLTKLKEMLFGVWERAQRTRDLGLIQEFDLVGTFEEVILQTRKCSKDTE